MTHQTQMNTESDPRNTKATSGPGGRARGRGWTLTINTPTQEDFENLKNLKCKITVFQTEVGKQSGLQHIQAGIYFDNARTFSSIKKIFPRAHIEKMKNLWATVNYCTKGDTWDGKYRYYSKDSKIILDVNETTAIAVKTESPLPIKDKILKALMEDFEENKGSWLKKLGIADLHYNDMI